MATESSETAETTSGRFPPIQKLLVGWNVQHAWTSQPEKLQQLAAFAVQPLLIPDQI
jgi:hypothetical protein